MRKKLSIPRRSESLSEVSTQQQTRFYLLGVKEIYLDTFIVSVISQAHINSADSSLTSSTKPSFRLELTFFLQLFVYFSHSLSTWNVRINSLSTHLIPPTHLNFIPHSFLCARQWTRTFFAFDVRCAFSWSLRVWKMIWKAGCCSEGVTRRWSSHQTHILSHTLQIGNFLYHKQMITSPITIEENYVRVSLVVLYQMEEWIHEKFNNIAAS